MSFTLGGLAIAMFILPGMFFFRGLYWPTLFSSSIERPNLTTQLGSILGVSVAVHGLALLTVRESPSAPDLAPLLEAMFGRQPLSADSASMWAHRLVDGLDSMLLYVVATSAAGAILGFVVGKGIINDVLYFRRLVDHGWVFDIFNPPHDHRPHWALRVAPWFVDTFVPGHRPEPTIFPYASVLSKAEHSATLLLYEGWLVSFGINPNGNLTYIALGDCRGRRFGAKTEFVVTGTTRRTDHNMIGQPFYIAGDNVHNIAFFALRYVSTRKGRQELEQLEEEIARGSDDGTPAVRATPAKPAP